MNSKKPQKHLRVSLNRERRMSTPHDMTDTTLVPLELTSKRPSETNLSKNTLINQKWINLMEPDENLGSKGGKKLCLRGRDLKPIDPDIFKLDLMLTALELSPDYRSCLSHKLDVLPHEIGNLVHLRELKLDTNDLKYVPSELASLVNLERLCLSNNSLKSLPEALGGLKSLKSLHLAKNLFQSIPLCVYEMSSLVFLDFTSNKLTNIDEGLLKLSHSLRFLSIFDNYIISLDSWIGGMVQLEQFWFGSNKINELPRELAKLKNIDWKEDYFSIILDGNPIDRPPISICREGLEAIEHWFEENDQMNKI